MRLIYLTNEKLAPIIVKLNEGQAKLDERNVILNKLNIEKEECDAKCAQLKREAEDTLRVKKETEETLERNKIKLVRAHKLLGGLADEKARWQEEVKRFR